MRTLATFLSSILLFTSISASAEVYGTPDEDPVIYQLQQKFVMSHVPVAAELNFTKEWVCQNFSARKGEVYVSESTLKFWAFDSLVMNSGSTWVTTLAYTPTVLVGPVTHLSNGSVMAIKAFSNDELIMERSLPRARAMEYSNSYKLITASMYSSANVATGYSVCLPKE